MTDEERLSAINEIVTELRNPKTGLNSLHNFVFASLPQTAKPGTLHEFILKYAITKKTNKKITTTDETRFNKIKAQYNMFVIKKIHEYKDVEKNSADFRQDILNNIIQNIQDFDNPQKHETENIFRQPLTDYNNMRETLNEYPHVFMKYGFSTSCANAAGAFAYEFSQKYKNQEICFLDTTKYDHLIDGRVGHVIPCVKLDENNWVAIEPLNKTIEEGVFTKIIPESDFQLGNSFEHLMPHHKDEPYIIRGKSSELPTNHEDFLENCSRVKLPDAKKFLAQVAKEEYWSPEMRTKIKRELEILSNLTPEEQKLPIEELQEKIEKKRKTQSLRLATEKVEQPAHPSPYVSTAELKKAQVQQAFFDY